MVVMAARSRSMDVGRTPSPGAKSKRELSVLAGVTVERRRERECEVIRNGS